MNLDHLLVWVFGALWWGLVLGSDRQFGTSL